MSEQRQNSLNSSAIVAGAIFMASALFYAGGMVSRQTEQIAALDKSVIRLEQRVADLERSQRVARD